MTNAVKHSCLPGIWTPFGDPQVPHKQGSHMPKDFAWPIPDRKKKRKLTALFDVCDLLFRFIIVCVFQNMPNLSNLPSKTASPSLKIKNIYKIKKMRSPGFKPPPPKKKTD